MITLLKKFFFDETAFIGLARAILIGLGTAVSAGLMPLEGLPPWAGVILAALGGFIRAGDPNPPAPRG